MNAGPANLGLICGNGMLPFAVAEAARAQGRRVVLFAIKGFADPDQVAAWPHHWFALGQAGRLIRLMHQEQCEDVTLVGGLVRPALRNLRFDFGALRLLPTVMRGFRGGDDHLLRVVGGVFEQAGFRMVGLQEIAPQVLAPRGALTRKIPSEAEREDIARGLDLLHTIGRFDIGQAAVVIDRHIVAIEGAEGTDGLLARVAAMRANRRINAPAGRGVLIKAPKPDQDLRFDLPTIGPRTIAGAKAAGLAGIAVAAGRSLMAEAQSTISQADQNALFVVGVDDGADPGA